MTLVLKPDLDIIKMYVCTKNEVSTFNSSKVIIWTDTQTDGQTDGQTDRQTDRLDWNYYLPHTRMVLKAYLRKSEGSNGRNFFLGHSVSWGGIQIKLLPALLDFRRQWCPSIHDSGIPQIYKLQFWKWISSHTKLRCLLKSCIILTLFRIFTTRICG